MKNLSEYIIESVKKEAEGKMDAWHNGTRKQNIKLCSNEKLIMNYGICMAKGYDKEAAELKAEMDKRNIKIDESAKTHNQKTYVIVCAYNDAYDYIIEEWADALVSTDHGNYFILPRTDVKALNDDKHFPEGDLKVYEFPDDYDALDDVEDALNNGELDPNDKPLSKCEIKL